MNFLVIEELIPVLQACVAPCVVISGVGLLLLAMTNRLARPIDRARQLCHEIHDADPADRPFLEEQIVIFYRRAGYLRTAIGLATASIFFVGIIILLLFATYVLGLPVGGAVEILFAASMLCLVGSMAFMLSDVALTLRSLRFEITKRSGVHLG